MKVSVLMVTFNHEQFIAQAIESVLMQEANFDYELIIGEDCSTDDTRMIVMDYQRRFPDRIRLLLHDRNLGMLRNFEKTYAACTGRYSALLDGDDHWISPHKLQRQVDFLETHPDFTICFHAADVIRDGRTIPAGWPPPETKDISGLEDIVESNFIPSCSVMYRMGPVPRFPDWMFSLGMGDWPLHVLYAQHGKIGYIRESMAVYREHRGGTWSARGRTGNHERVIKAYTCIDEQLQHRYADRIRPMISLHYYELAWLYKEAGDAKSAWACARKSFTVSPFNRRIPRFRQLKALAELASIRTLCSSLSVCG